MKKLLSLLTTSALLCTGLMANTVSESQGDWFKKYQKQANAPKPAEMLLNTDAEPDLTTGFESLYNGKDLKNWTPKGGFCEFVANGDMITGTCVPKSPSTYLSTLKDDYTNFVFSCDIKWEVDGNTGVMFRAISKKGTKKGKPTETVMGPQAEMEGIAKGRGWSGGIYGQSCGGYYYPLWLDAPEKARNALKADGWNRITIKTEGPNIKTWINGIPASNCNVEEYQKGFFSLQIHSGKQGKVHFKNIKVKEL